MGLKGFIEFIRDTFPCKFLFHSIPNYRPWISEQDMEEELDRSERALDQSRLVTVEKSNIPSHVDDKKAEQRILSVNQGPNQKLIKIEDWMLALRQFRSRSRAEGYKLSGSSFYEHLIKPVIEYGQGTNVDYIVLCVDKGSPPEKLDTQIKRNKDALRNKKRKRLKELSSLSLSTEQDSTNRDEEEQGKRETKEEEEEEEKLPDDVEISDEGFVVRSVQETDQDSIPKASSSSWKRSRDPNLFSTSDPTSSQPRSSRFFSNSSSSSSLPLTLSSSFSSSPSSASSPSSSLKKKVLPFDPERIMGHSNRSLRIKLYEYLLKRMIADHRFFRVVNGKKVYFRIVFDFDLKGPWRIQYSPETKRGIGACMPQFANGILEADLACFWWASHYSQHDVFIHAGDTDYIAIALLNAHLFQRSLVVQIRAHDRYRDPVCMETSLARYSLYQLGMSCAEFCLGCVMNGNDFVDRSAYICGLGDRFVWEGIALYRRIRQWFYAEWKLLETGVYDTRSFSLRLLESLKAILLCKHPVWNSAEDVPLPFVRPSSHSLTLLSSSSSSSSSSPLNSSSTNSSSTPRTFPNSVPPSSRAGEWVNQTVFREYPYGIDAIVCCIYLVYYHDRAARKSRIGKNQTFARFVHGQAITPKHLPSILISFIRPVLEQCSRPTSSKPADSKKKRTRKKKKNKKEDPEKEEEEEKEIPMLPPHPSMELPKAHRRVQIPLFENENYQKVLVRIRFLLNYWSTLQGCNASVWE